MVLITISVNFNAKSVNKILKCSVPCVFCDYSFTKDTRDINAC